MLFTQKSASKKRKYDGTTNDNKFYNDNKFRELILENQTCRIIPQRTNLRSSISCKNCQTNNENRECLQMRAGSGIYPLRISVVSKNDNEITKELFVDENHEIVEEGSENSMDSIEKPRYIDLPSFSNSSMVGSVPSFHNEDSTFVGSNSMKLLPSQSILNSPPQKS